MDVIIAPVDSNRKLVLKDVEICYPTLSALVVVYKNGKNRSYPLVHIWNWETPPAPDALTRTKPLEEI